jgi:hypothetical protein
MPSTATATATSHIHIHSHSHNNCHCHCHCHPQFLAHSRLVKPERKGLHIVRAKHSLGKNNVKNTHFISKIIKSGKKNAKYKRLIMNKKKKKGIYGILFFMRNFF